MSMSLRRIRNKRGPMTDPCDTPDITGKAFDKVDHKIVLQKLSLLGVRGKLLLWIKSFLTSRTQRVMVNGVLSNACPVISGVPQGSVIGPLLFLVLLSDIDMNIVSSFLSSFADDTRLSQEEFQMLQVPAPCKPIWKRCTSGLKTTTCTSTTRSLKL